MTPDIRTTIARHLAETDVFLDTINSDLVGDMNLYSVIEAVRRLRLAIAHIADEVAALDPANQPIDRIPTPKALDYLAVRQEQHPRTVRDFRGITGEPS